MHRPWFLFFLAAAGACRTAGPPAEPRTPAPAVTRSAPTRAPFRAQCGGERASDAPDWDAVTATEPLLRAALAACDPRAPMAAAKANAVALVPELRDLLDEANVQPPTSREAPMFRLMVVDALTALDPATDYAPNLVALLSHADAQVRLGAAFHAREQKLASVRGPLLALVRDDPNVSVRRQAAETLFLLAGVRPPYVHGHKGLPEALEAVDPQRRDRAARMVEHLLGEP
jgi:HEAT repeat protein